MGRFLDVPQRGEERERMLASFRAGLRGLVNPRTGDYWSEADVARATQEGGRWWAEFDATELAVLALHAKATGLADQFVPSRSTTGTLRGLHAELHEVTPLPASGATLICEATAEAGAIFVGSTTIPDPTAAFAVDSAGLRYQVLFTVIAPANGIAGSDPSAPLYLVGVDTGERTNLAAGTRKLTWSGNQPLSAELQFDVTVDGSGGIDDETDGELAARIEADIRHQPESGNNAHVRAWARQASTAVEDAFPFACAKYSGTSIICITQKRGRQRESAPKGPTARIPSAGTLARVRAFTVPPASPVVPERIVTLVVPPVAQSINMTLGLALPRGRGLGWFDTRPWPLYSSGPASVATVTNQTHFRIASAVPLPSGSLVPRIMVWDIATSRWELLRVTSVVSGGAGFWDVVLSTAPAHTLVVGDFISPALRDTAIPLLGQSVERYFDGLGPGEVIDLETDPRAPRAQRFPDPVERYPQRAGSTIISTLQSVLTGTITTGEVLEQSATTPTVPGDPATGPSMLVAGRLAVYPSD